MHLDTDDHNLGKTATASATEHMERFLDVHLGELWQLGPVDMGRFVAFSLNTSERVFKMMGLVEKCVDLSALHFLDLKVKLGCSAFIAL